MVTSRTIVGLIVAPGQIAEKAVQAIRGGGLIGEGNPLYLSTDIWPNESIPGVANTRHIPMTELFRQFRDPASWEDPRMDAASWKEKDREKESSPSYAPPFIVYFLSKDVPADIECELERRRLQECYRGGKLGFLKVPLSAVDPLIEEAPRRQTDRSSSLAQQAQARRRRPTSSPG